MKRGTYNITLFNVDNDEIDFIKQYGLQVKSRRVTCMLLITKQVFMLWPSIAYKVEVVLELLMCTHFFQNLLTSIRTLINHHNISSEIEMDFLQVLTLY